MYSAGRMKGKPRGGLLPEHDHAHKGVINPTAQRKVQYNNHRHVQPRVNMLGETRRPLKQFSTLAMLEKK